jgi:hypothetical protein
MFKMNEKQDIFEYEHDKLDWKYPKYVKVDKNRKYQEQEIDHYNEMNVTK